MSIIAVGPSQECRFADGALALHTTTGLPSKLHPIRPIDQPPSQPFPVLVDPGPLERYTITGLRRNACSRTTLP